MREPSSHALLLVRLHGFDHVSHVVHVVLILNAGVEPVRRQLPYLPPYHYLKFKRFSNQVLSLLVQLVDLVHQSGAALRRRRRVPATPAAARALAARVFLILQVLQHRHQLHLQDAVDGLAVRADNAAVDTRHTPVHQRF